MSRVSIAEWERRAAAVLPVSLPTLTEGEAVRATRKLWRFVRRRKLSGKVEITTGIRGSYYQQVGGGAVINIERGWRGLLSELIFNLGSDKRSRAKLALKAHKMMVKRGWFTGALRDAPPKVETRVDRVNDREQRLQRRLERWQRRERIAKAAIKRIRAKLKRIDKARLHAATADALLGVSP